MNLDDLNSFTVGAEVTPEILCNEGIIKKVVHGLKVLGRGELPHALRIKAHAFSESARKKIEAAGGKAEVIRV